MTVQELIDILKPLNPDLPILRKTDKGFGFHQVSIDTTWVEFDDQQRPIRTFHVNPPPHAIPAVELI